MNRSQELECLDFACRTTIAKKQMQGKTQIQKDINEAIDYYVKYANPNGFTRDDNARGYVRTLSKKSIDKELFLNIVKLAALKQYRGEETLLKINKGFEDDLSNEEFELLTFEAIRNPNNSMHTIIEYYNANPKLYDMLVFSFVHRRYFDRLHTKEALDDNDMMATLWDYASLQGKVESGFNQSRSY